MRGGEVGLACLRRLRIPAHGRDAAPRCGADQVRAVEGQLPCEGSVEDHAEGELVRAPVQLRVLPHRGLGRHEVRGAEEHLVPGLHFSYPGPEAPRAQLFFSFYFTLTGLHALHMVIGVGILLVLLGGAARGRYSSLYHSPVELSGLYWHFVDIVWIYLYPLLYLINRSS